MEQKSVENIYGILTAVTSRLQYYCDMAVSEQNKQK